MAGFLSNVEELKQTAIDEFNAATDMPALEHAKDRWIGPNGPFTALEKQLDTLPVGERPAANQVLNRVKAELGVMWVARREGLKLKAALFLDQVNGLKQTVIDEFNAATDIPALEHAKGRWIGPNGQFTALMKQLGTIPKEDRPAAGKVLNQVKAELGVMWVARREGLKLKAALPRIQLTSPCPDAAASSASSIR